MILSDIVEYRKLQLEKEKSLFSAKELIKLADKIGYQENEFKKNIMDYKGMSIIAEIKKASPSKGMISENINPVEVAKAYENSNVQAISILTEEHYFHGNNMFIKQASKEISTPILRKDFIFDEYQIYHAKVLGASAVLLIAAILSKAELKKFKETARECNLDVLIEIHDRNELETALLTDTQLIGINNRDLKTFKTDINTTISLMNYVPASVTVISESGIRSREDIVLLEKAGVKGILIGETLMRAKNIGETIASLRGEAL